MEQIIEEEVNSRQGIIPGESGGIRVRFPGEVDDHPLSPDQLHVQEPPKSAVIAVVAVVTHYEYIPLGNPYRTEVIPVVYPTRDLSGVGMLGFWRLRDKLSVNIYPLVLYLHHLACGSYNPLDIISLPVQRIFEDNHLPRLRML